ncbi:MAG: hypothetical protein V4525_03905 [Pseudomonadota bacterium]
MPQKSHTDTSKHIEKAAKHHLKGGSTHDENHKKFENDDALTRQ